MGLRNIHLDKFDAKRLWITILGENLPQLLLQGYYWFVSDNGLVGGGVEDRDMWLLGMAMISGILSILYAFGVICSGIKENARFEDDALELYEVNIISEFDFPSKAHKRRSKNRAYKYRLYPLQKGLAAMLNLDQSFVEIHPPTKIENGYQLRFTLMVKELGGNTKAWETLEGLLNGVNAKGELGTTMAQMIEHEWALDQTPILQNLQWKKDRIRSYKKNMVLLAHKGGDGSASRKSMARKSGSSPKHRISGVHVNHHRESGVHGRDHRRESASHTFSNRKEAGKRQSAFQYINSPALQNVESSASGHEVMEYGKDVIPYANVPSGSPAPNSNHHSFQSRNSAIPSQKLADIPLRPIMRNQMSGVSNQSNGMRQQRSFSNHRQPPQEFGSVNMVNVPHPPAMAPNPRVSSVHHQQAQRASMHHHHHHQKRTSAAKHRVSAKDQGGGIFNEKQRERGDAELDSIMNDVAQTYGADEDHGQDHGRFDSMASNDSEAEFQMQLMTHIQNNASGHKK